MTKFVIQGSKPKYKELWNKLDSGMPVDILYKEELKITEQRIDGKWVKIKTEITDYDFIDANFSPDKTAEISPSDY